MGLFERIAPGGEDQTDKISVHRFGSSLREVARRSDGGQGFTLAQVHTKFNLSPGEQSELASIAAKYSGLSTDKEKSDFMHMLEDTFLLVETGDHDEATAKSRLGF